MTKLIYAISGKVLKFNEKVKIGERMVTYRWHTHPTDLSPGGTVYVSDDTGRVTYHHATDHGLRVVDADYVPVERKRRVRSVA